MISFSIYEFLLRGPYAKSHPKAIPALALLDGTGSWLTKEVETVLGSSLEDIEKAWIAWGSKPPEAKPARK